MKLTIELVPETCWYTNVRSNVPDRIWDLIRKKSYKEAGHKCQVCSDSGKNQGYKHDVECHEIWDYDDKNKVQKLIGFISLCPFCHKVKHPGLANIKGETHIVIDQLKKVNGMNDKEIQNYMNEVFEQWQERSKHQWILDISYADKYLNEKEEA
jgi:hypothetical protein